MTDDKISFYWFSLNLFWRISGIFLVIYIVTGMPKVYNIPSRVTKAYTFSKQLFFTFKADYEIFTAFGHRDIPQGTAFVHNLIIIRQWYVHSPGKSYYSGGCN